MTINTISRDRFVMLIKMLEDVCSWQASKRTISAWWELFKGVPEDKLSRAFKFAVKEITFKPMPKYIFDGLDRAGYVPPVHIRATPPINHETNLEPI